MSTKPTILYVEDEEGVRNTLCKLLSRFSSNLYVAENGKIGLELFKQHSPDIIITDIRMPVMNGIDMVKHIQDISSQQHIIFTTAHSESEYFIDAIETHADGYILKPISFSILTNKLEQITKQINTEKELKAQHILTDEITQMLNLLIVLDDKNNIIYSNKNFLKFFSLSSLEQFNTEYKNISNVFVNYGDFFYPKKADNWIEEIENLEDDQRVVSMVNELSEPQAFVLSLKQVEETKHTIIIFTEITNLTIKKNELQYKAYTDTLTKIGNKTYFEDELKKEFKKAKITKEQLSIILFDIDSFDDINTTYSNKIGDDILIELATIVEKNISKNDIFARYSTHKFVQILPQTSIEYALLVANRVKKVISNHTFTQGIKISCSFGITDNVCKQTKDEMIEDVQQALLKAKESSKDKICSISQTT